MDRLITASQVTGAQTHESITNVANHHALDITTGLVDDTSTIHGHWRPVVVVFEGGRTRSTNTGI